MVPAAAIQAAAEHGIEYLAFTDHIHEYTDLSILDEVREKISSIAAPMKVYIGCEADIMSVGRGLVTSELIKKTDFIMVAANHFVDPAISQPASRDNKDVARHFLEMFTYAVSLENVDVIAHPLFVMPNSYDLLAPSLLTEKELAPAIDLAVKNNIAMEISRRALSKKQMPFLLSFYRLCKEAGLKFSIGSDAHKLSDVGRTIRVEPLINELGLSDEDIWLPQAG
jgi:putative hydrolase